LLLHDKIGPRHRRIHPDLDQNPHASRLPGGIRLGVRPPSAWELSQSAAVDRNRQGYARGHAMKKTLGLFAILAVIGAIAASVTSVLDIDLTAPPTAYSSADGSQ
jgi:hypothetical protein